MVEPDRLQSRRFRASRPRLVAGIALLVLIITTAGLAIWDRSAEGGGGNIDALVRVVAIHPLRDYPLIDIVSAAQKAVLADWGRQSLFLAFGSLCAAIGFALLFRALLTRSHSLERAGAALRESEARCHEAKATAAAAHLAKSQFLANISHELRKPLNAILGFAEVLENGTGGQLQSRQAEYVGLIRQNGEDLLHLINEVLDLARIDAGRLDLHEEIIEPSKLVGSAIALVKDRAAAGLLKLAVDVEEDMPALSGDRTRLRQILVNLLSNAIKSTELGGAINVLVRRTEAGGAAFVVRDNGRGMTEDEIEIALERFGQLDGGLAHRHEGSSLGLPLARKLAELHGGSLTLQSEKGRGTAATLVLPPSRVVSVKPSVVGLDDRSAEARGIRPGYPMAADLDGDQRTGCEEGPRVPFDEYCPVP